MKSLKQRLFEAQERFSDTKWLNAEPVKNGTLEEAWGTGTAAVISPIGLLEVNGKKYQINNGKIGEISQMLYDEITGIQSGKKKDTYNWTVEVK